MNNYSKPTRSGAAVLASIAHSRGDDPYPKSGNMAPILVNLAAFGANVFPLSAHPHDMAQTAAPAMDIQKIATGFCSSSVVGSKVYNDLEDEVGRIEGLLLDSENHKGPHVVVSVDNANGRMVAVPYCKLRIDNYRIVLAGIAKKDLMAMPEFKYAMH